MFVVFSPIFVADTIIIFQQDFVAPLNIPLHLQIQRGIANIQWALSISTTLYLEYPSISNKIFSPLKFSPRTLHSLSLFRTSPYIEQISQFIEPFSLSISSIYIFEFQTKISTVNEKNLFFLFKRKLNTKTMEEKCDTLSHIEKEMTNKEAADKFCVPKTPFQLGLKTTKKFFKRLKKVLQALRNYVVQIRKSRQVSV